MKFIKDQSAWKRWVKAEGLASQAFETSPPLEYPCYAYCTVHSFGYEELDANYLYAVDISKMGEAMMKKEVVKKSPKYKIGDIIRHGDGSTALMKVTDVSLNHGSDHRYYGKSYYGSSVGVYELDAREATQNEITKFKTDNHLNRLRDYPEFGV